MPLYAVQTPRFGELLVERDNIADARAWARTAHRVRNPGQVRRHKPYRHCDDCDSAPCCCPKETP